MRGKTYRVAVIGQTGRGNYGHDLDVVWLDMPDVAIVAVADEDAEGRARAAERLGAPRAYAGYREMLEREKPELVSVAPHWPACHQEMALACAEEGVRGVLMEKPLASSLAEADAMVAACERTGMKMALCHQTRYNPRVAAAREAIAAGRIGDLLELRARGKEDSRGGGEDMLVLGTHMTDLMRLLAGDPQWCFGRVTENGAPVGGEHVRDVGKGLGPVAGDAVTATYGFAPPLTGHFATHRARDGASARFALHVLGSKGQMLLPAGMGPVYVLEDPAWNPGRSGAAWQTIDSRSQGDDTLRHGNQLIVRDLIRCIEENEQPLGSIYDGRAALEMILAVYESHGRGAPVALPLTEREHPLERLR
jgi:predicted dehydrogenase